MKKAIITAVLMGVLLTGSLTGCKSNKPHDDGYIPWWAKQEKTK